MALNVTNYEHIITLETMYVKIKHWFIVYSYIKLFISKFKGLIAYKC